MHLGFAVADEKLRAAHDLFQLMLTMWCEFCDHKLPGRANCSRGFKLGKPLAEVAAEDLDRVRRYLWWWASRAQEFSRKDHQGLPRDIPDDLMSIDDIMEYITMSYDAEVPAPA